MPFTLVCAACGESFEAKSARAKWCGSACRKRAQRNGVEAPESEVDERPESDFTHELVASVRRELEGADAVDSFFGRLALQLARRLTDPDESGISALSKELRTVMEAATASQRDAAEPDPDADLPDPLKRARARRDAARQAAGQA